MKRWCSKAARHLGALALTTLLGGMFSATLVRTSPGYGVDERLLDSRLDENSRASIRTQLGAGEPLASGPAGRKLSGSECSAAGTAAIARQLSG